MARSINLLHIAKAMNDGRAIEIQAEAMPSLHVQTGEAAAWNLPTAVEWDASKCRTARSSALGIIIVVCGAVAIVNFAALVLVP